MKIVLLNLIQVFKFSFEKTQNDTDTDCDWSLQLNRSYREMKSFNKGQQLLCNLRGNSLHLTWQRPSVFGFYTLGLKFISKATNLFSCFVLQAVSWQYNLFVYICTDPSANHAASESKDIKLLNMSYKHKASHQKLYFGLSTFQ